MTEAAPVRGHVEGFVARYEATRSAFLEGGRACGPGLIELLRGGIPRWLEAMTEDAQAVSATRLGPAITPALALDPLLAELTSMLANVVFPLSKGVSP